MQTLFIMVMFVLAAVASPAAELPPPLELIVLGSGGPGATGRASSSYLLLVEGTPRILVDAGSGSFVTLGKSGQSLAATDIVLLTHLHIDHVGDLPGLFKARAVSSGAALAFNIWGPSGSGISPTGAYFPSTTTYVEQQFGKRGIYSYLRDFSAPITWVVHDIASSSGEEPKVVYQQGDLMIRAISGHHGDVPAVIYRVDHVGRSVTFSGDIDEKGLARLSRIARDSELLVFNCVVLDPPGSPPILYTLHSPPAAIGEVAAEAHVRRVLLSHLTPSIEGHREVVEASIHMHFKGSVEFAEDGMHVRP